MLPRGDGVPGAECRPPTHRPLLQLKSVSKRPAKPDPGRGEVGWELFVGEGMEKGVCADSWTPTQLPSVSWGSPAHLPCVTLKGKQAFNCATAYSTVTCSLLALPRLPACSARHTGLLRILSRACFLPGTVAGRCCRLLVLTPTLDWGSVTRRFCLSVLWSQVRAGGEE